MSMESQNRLKIRGLKKIINPIYWDHMISNKHEVQIYFGGSSSGKSYSLAQRAVIDVMQGRNYLALRKVARTLRRSVFNEIEEKINEMGLRKYFRINISDMEFTCLLNKRQIILAGLDDVEKIKSIRPKKGPITDIWVEEATEMSYADYKALKKRFRGIMPEGWEHLNKRFTLSFNPILQTNWMYLEFFVDLWDDAKQYVENQFVSILKTTYKDNNFLTQQDIDLLENESDEYYYNVYTLGNWGVLGAVIYKNWKVEEFDKTKFSQYRNGLDWGYESPLAFIRLAIEKSQRRIYICDEIYKTQLTNDKSGVMVKEKAGTELVWCDSAEPKSVKEYRMMGLMSKSVEKGKGSILEGIKYIQKFEIIVHPDCENFKKEASQYRRKEDKDGNVLEEPIDKNDHLMDAMRYALEYDMKYASI